MKNYTHPQVEVIRLTLQDVCLLYASVEGSLETGENNKEFQDKFD